MWWRIFHSTRLMPSKLYEFFNFPKLRWSNSEHPNSNMRKVLVTRLVIETLSGRVLYVNYIWIRVLYVNYIWITKNAQTCNSKINTEFSLTFVFWFITKCDYITFMKLNKKSILLQHNITSMKTVFVYRVVSSWKLKVSLN